MVSSVKVVNKIKTRNKISMSTIATKGMCWPLKVLKVKVYMSNMEIAQVVIIKLKQSTNTTTTTC